MIHETSESGPWFDLDEIAAITHSEDDVVKVTLKSGNELDFFVDEGELESLVSAWMSHRRSLEQTDSPAKRSL